MIHFDNDYHAGAHPEVMRCLQQTNEEFAVGYGLDPYSEQARKLIRKACEAPDALVQFLVGGTQTNAVVIDALLRHCEGVMAAETAHINVHESGAIEFGGHKVLTLPSHFGKVKVEEVRHYLSDFYQDETYPHMVAPGMLYITQPTELGTIYSLSELEALSALCREYHIPLYLDGARLSYALAADEADFTLADIARLCDVFYIGGTKCGAMFGEAVVAREASLLPRFFSLVKQHGALLAKGRLQGVQFSALFADDLYLRIAKEAVRKAKLIRDAFVKNGFRQTHVSPTNQQFFVLPNKLIDKLLENVSFEYWGARGETESMVRFVTDWSTSQQEVEQLVELIEQGVIA